MQDSQVNNLPPALITVTSDIFDSKPIKPSASMIIKTSTQYRRSQSYAPPTKASDNLIDPKMRAYKPLRSLINLSSVTDGEPRVPFATRQLLAT